MLKIILFNEFMGNNLSKLDVDENYLYYSKMWGPLHVFDKETLKFRALFINRKEQFYTYHIDKQFLYFYQDDKIHVIDKQTYEEVGVCEKIITEDLIKAKEKCEKDTNREFLMFKRVCASNNDFFYICSAYQQSVVVFDKKTWKEVHTIKFENWSIRDIYADDSYLYILEVSRGKPLRILSNTNWEEIKQISPTTYDIPDRFESICLDEQYIYLLGGIQQEKKYPSYQGAIIILKKGTWEKIFEIRHLRIISMRIKGQYLYLIKNGNIIEIWDTKKWEVLDTIIDEKDDIQLIAIGTEYMFSTTKQGKLKKWNLASNKVVKTLYSKTIDVNSVAIDDEYIYVGSDIGSIRIWDRESLQTERILREDKNSIKVFIYDDYLFGTENITHVWERGTWNKVQEIDLTLNAIDYDEKYVYYCDYGHYVKVGNPITFDVIRILHHSDWVNIIKVDDNFLYSADNHVLSIWNKENWKQVIIIEPPDDTKIRDLLLDNDYIYVFTDGKIVQTWKKKVWKKVQERDIDRFDNSFVLYGDYVFCLNVSSNSIKIRDNNSWELVKEFVGYGEILIYRLYKDTLVIASIDGIVSVYSLKDYSLQYVFYNNSDYNLDLFRKYEECFEKIDLVGECFIASIKEDNGICKEVLKRIINEECIPVKDHKYGLIYDKDAIGN
ncbi:MAG: hypothetical protein GF311_01570 [Candidatus Lokiarchaeota archaeon]|nr:hypothetical protein [Candidatus Lokiarchaeota archaeon]